MLKFIVFVLFVVMAYREILSGSVLRNVQTISFSFDRVCCTEDMSLDKSNIHAGPVGK